MVSELLFETEHLNKNAEYGYSGDCLLSLVLSIKNQSEFLQEVEITQALVDCLSQNRIKNRKNLQILVKVVMRAAFPGV
jgi:hypothetical protein